MIKKPIPTACDILMNSFLSGSGGGLVMRRDLGLRRRTGAAVHEQSALFEELSGHTARRLAIVPHRVPGCSVLGELLDVVHGGWSAVTVMWGGLEVP
jgi:hypothetical protein